jgi:hypothetical protein
VTILHTRKREVTGFYLPEGLEHENAGNLRIGEVAPVNAHRESPLRSHCRKPASQAGPDTGEVILGLPSVTEASRAAREIR